MPRAADLLNYRTPQLAAGQVDRSIPMATPSGQFVPTPPTESQLKWEGALSNPSIANILYGAGETAYGLVTAPIPYAAGMVGSAYGALTGQDPRATGARFEQATTFQPQSPTGQYYSEQAGEKFSSLPPVVSGIPLATLGQGSMRYAGEQYAKPIAEKGLTMYEQGKLTPGMTPISELTAWHGSPHQIKGGFSLEKVGTGEGAQVYGHGMYFAEAKDTAKNYATDRSYVGKFMRGTPDPTPWDAKRIAQNALNIYGDNAIKELEKTLKNNSFSKNTKQIEANKQIEDSINILKTNELKPLGNLYKVDIPDEQIPMMLDWDKPLSKQNPEVFNLLAKHPAIQEDIAKGRTLDNLTGKDAYNAIAASFDVGQKEAYKLASEYLNKSGVPGIRYLDQGSRGAGQGTSNFVSFQPEAVKILEVNDKPYTPDVFSILYK